MRILFISTLELQYTQTLHGTAIYGYIGVVSGVNVGIYGIHGASGLLFARTHVLTPIWIGDDRSPMDHLTYPDIYLQLDDRWSPILDDRVECL